MSHLRHLAGRFFRSLRARHPGPDAQALVADHLDGPERAVFWDQPVADIDHAVRGARFLVEQHPNRPDLVRAFLLHDIGKRRSGLGTVRRSMATALALVGLSSGGRGRRYLDHGELGASELEDLGAPPLVVSFARHHHDPRPHDVDAADWAALVAADHR